MKRQKKILVFLLCFLKMFPLLQLQIATNILHAENSDNAIEYIAQQNTIDPSVFNFQNYSAILPNELLENEETSHLTKVPIKSSDGELIITEIPKDVKTIRIFKDTHSILPLTPGELGIINEGNHNRGAFYLTPEPDLRSLSNF